jgi:hypothetical protein
LSLNEIMNGLSAQFMNLNISKAAAYNFMKEKYRISLKRHTSIQWKETHPRTSKENTNELKDR